MGGDYDFLSECLGHQGQAASFPSLTDLVTLKNHSGRTHNIKNCVISVRDCNDYNQNFCEKMLDERANNNFRKNGKEHNSVIDLMLFPFKTL